MTAAIVAAVAATLGIILGRFWDARSEATRWKRDQMTTSYQHLGEAFRRTVEAIRTVALSDPADPASPELVASVRNDSSWDDAHLVVLLHGTPTVVQAAVAMDLAITELFYTAQDHHHRVEDWYRIRIPAGRALENFIDRVRAELDLKPIPVKYRTPARQVPAPDHEQLP